VRNLLSIDRGSCAEPLLRSVVGDLILAHRDKLGRDICSVARVLAPEPKSKHASQHHGDEESERYGHELSREYLKLRCLLGLHLLASYRRVDGRLVEITPAN
jgi:hypothetical protein